MANFMWVKKYCLLFSEWGHYSSAHFASPWDTQTGLQYGFDQPFSLLQLFLLPPFEDHSGYEYPEAMGSF